jgi:hypothetical protein
VACRTTGDTLGAEVVEEPPVAAGDLAEGYERGVGDETFGLVGAGRDRGVERLRASGS